MHFLRLDQVPASQRVASHDGAWVLGWYVARHSEDRYDESTTWWVGLFEARTGDELTSFVTSSHERADTGAKEGSALVSAAFDPVDDEVVVLRYADGTEGRHRVDEEFRFLDSSAQDFGGVAHPAEERVRERARARLQRLKRSRQR